MEHLQHPDRGKLDLERLEGLQKKTRIERAMIPRKHRAVELRRFLRCCDGDPSITVVPGQQTVARAA